MVEVLLHADALAGTEDNPSARFDDVLYAVDAEMDRRVGKLLVLVGIVEFDDEIAAATVDDVLHLRPVEVHRRLLTFLDNHDFLGVRFLVNAVPAVADGEEEEAAAQEVAGAEVGDVPAEHAFRNVPSLVLICLPVGKPPFCPFRQEELTGGKE